MRNFDAVIFDLDGTLLDTSEGIFRSVCHVIDTLGLPKLSDDVMRTFIGPPIQKSFARIYGMSGEDSARAAGLFRDRYKETDLLLAKPYDGIFEAIRELKGAGVKTAVATYKRQDYAEKILNHFGFDRVCDVMCGSDFEGVLSKRDIIENAINGLGIYDRSRIVMVGDSDNDAIGAEEIDVSFIGVTYGFGFESAKDVNGYKNIGSAQDPSQIVRIVL
ncbi:MAG: HAD hydrolase-like protein [Lachnospiraceae bacterium]|nr:HAD hydrolase-like protein [Lachnospiraceae bacterium]